MSTPKLKNGPENAVSGDNTIGGIGGEGGDDRGQRGIAGGGVQMLIVQV